MKISLVHRPYLAGFFVLVLGVALGFTAARLTEPAPKKIAKKLLHEVEWKIETQEQLDSTLERANLIELSTSHEAYRFDVAALTFEEGYFARGGRKTEASGLMRDLIKRCRLVPAREIGARAHTHGVLRIVLHYKAPDAHNIVTGYMECDTAVCDIREITEAIWKKLPAADKTPERP